MPLEKFSYLTGAAFLPSTEKFNTSPQQWLTKKRQELAHPQLSEKNRKPADVYLESGFEHLSHHSFAFKKKYGYSANKVAQQF